MGKFDQYKIPLKSLKQDTYSFEYMLDNDYFKNIDGQEVQKGNVSAVVNVKSRETDFDLTFNIHGTVKVPCDRCLDDVEVEVSHQESMHVKFGPDFSEEGENTIVVPEHEGELNVAWFLYEFIALSVPIKHIHAPGKCNKMMSGKLKVHLTKTSSDVDEEDMDDDLEIDDEFIGFEDETEQNTDPRWDELKKIIDNN